MVFKSAGLVEKNSGQRDLLPKLSSICQLVGNQETLLVVYFENQAAERSKDF